MDLTGPGALEPAPTLSPLGDTPRAALDALSARGFRRVQLDAARPGLRPRELDRSARRDLAAALRRRELAPAGLDLWIPPAHLVDPGHTDRAVRAVVEAIGLAADLGGVPVSLELPPDADATAVAAITAESQRRDVPVADHALPAADGGPLSRGVDPARWLGAGEDPVAAVHAAGDRLAAARLSDLDAGGRAVPAGGPGGRLDLLAYRVALSVCGFARPVVLDARGLADPWSALEAGRAAWERLG
ncbi:MAG: hypothetical protein ACYTG1_07960 [Planctomycetota bacterium]|jgi:sugar phosphate isomerase/epimerase